MSLAILGFELYKNELKTLKTRIIMEKEQRRKQDSIEESKLSVMKSLTKTKSFVYISIDEEMDNDKRVAIVFGVEGTADRIVSLLRSMDDAKKELLEMASEGMPPELKELLDGMKDLVDKLSTKHGKKNGTKV